MIPVLGSERHYYRNDSQHKHNLIYTTHIRGYALSQHAYIDSFIPRYHFTDLKPSAISMDPCAPLSKSQLPTKLADIARMENVPYREAVGPLMYAAMGTRPDIAFDGGPIFGQSWMGALGSREANLQVPTRDTEA